MPPNSRRIINVPVAIVTLFLRKLLDTCAGAYSDQVVRTSGLQSFFRRFIRISGSNIVLFGAAASTFIYYLKKYKVLQIVRKRVTNRRLRESMTCITTSSLTHHPSTTQTQPSIRLLFQHPNPNSIFQLCRSRILKGRPSNLDLVESSSVLPPPFKTSSAPCPFTIPGDIQSAETIVTRANSSPANFASSSVSVTIGRTSIAECNAIAPTNTISEHSLVTFHPSPRPSLNHTPASNIQSIYNLHSMRNEYTQPRRTQHQDIYGNIYECESMRMLRNNKSVCIDLGTHDLKHSSNTAGTERTLCEGDYSRYDDNDDDIDLNMFAPSVIREISPSKEGLTVGASIKVSSKKVRKKKHSGKRRKRKPQSKRRAPPVRDRRKVAEIRSENVTVQRRSTRLQHKRAK